MTKTFKKGLVACLIAIMAVLVGITATAVGGVKAEVDTASVESFKEYIQVFSEIQTFDEDTLFGTEENYITKYELWTAYNGAKRLYSNMSPEDKAAIGAERATFDKIDGVMGNTYTIVANITSTLYGYDKSNTYKDNTYVVQIREAYEGLNTQKKQYVSNSTNELQNLKLAEQRMAYLKDLLDKIEEAIQGIQYENAGMTSEPAYTGESDTMKIVLASQDTITAVETAIKAYPESNVTAPEKMGQVPTTVFNDKECVDSWKYYEAAQAALAAQKAKAQAVIDKIEEVFAEKVDATLYYTISGKIQACTDAYEALDSSANNNLQTLVTNKVEKLDVMTAYIEALKTKIETAKTTIAAITDSASAKFNDEYKGQIEAAEAAVVALDADIKAYDEARYAAKGQEVTVEEGSAFGKDFTEFNVSYIVEGFEKMKAAREQYDGWQAEVDDLVAQIKDLIVDYEAHKNVTDKFNKLNDKYSNPHELTAEQMEAFKQTEVDFAEAEGGRTTCEEVMRAINAFVDRMTALTSSLDAEILALYNKTLLDCAYFDRANVASLRTKYNELIRDNPDAEPYVLNYDKLQEMEAEVAAEDALIEAWIAKVEAIEETVTVNNWDKVDEAKAEYEKILHGVSDGTKKLQGYVSGGNAGLTNANSKDIDANYTKYNTAVEAEKTLKEAITALVNAMMRLDDTGSLGLEDVDQFKTDVDNVTTSLNALKDQGVTGEWLVANNTDDNKYEEAWNKYQSALVLYDRYNAESLINHLYQENQFTDYETNPQTLISQGHITLASANAIAEARKAVTTYTTNHADDNAQEQDIRNITKLQAAEEALASITAELNAWMRSVIRLVNPDFDQENATDRAAILEALNEFIYPDLAKESQGFLGYPLDLNAFKTVKDNYTTLVGDLSDMDKVLYVWDVAWAMDYIYNKGHGEAKDRDGNILKHINDMIADITSKLDAGTPLEAADLDTVTEIIDTYEKLHETQKTYIDNYDKIGPATDTLNAQLAFGAMLEALYKEVVTDGNVTSYTPYYLAVVKAIYDQFGESVKATFTDYEAKVAAIQNAYDAAVEAGTVVALNKVKEELDALNETLTAADKGLEDKLGAASDKLDAASDKLDKAVDDLIAVFKGEAEAEDLTAAVEAFEARITEAYTTAIEEAVSAAQEALQAQIDALTKALGDAKTELSQKSDARFNELTESIKGINTTISELQGKVGELTKTLDNLRSELQAKIDAKADASKLDEEIAARTQALKDLNTRLATLESNLSGTASDLNNLETTLKAVDADLQQQITELAGKVNDLESSLKAKDDELKAQADQIESKTKTLMALAIVALVLVAAAIACIVVLFVKKSKNNN